MRRGCIVLLAVLLSGCGDGDRTSSRQISEATLPGVYSGTFPCDGCPGIPTTLWLRADGRFFLAQNYPAEGEREAMTAHSLGRWHLSDNDPIIDLRSAGPVRRFEPVDAGTLIMQTDSDLEHRLSRHPTKPAFTASIRMAGMMRLNDGAAGFTECWTGLEASIVEGRELSRFRHQYRGTIAPGEPAFVELEGRFSWSSDGSASSMTIDRFITVKTDGTC